MKNLTFVVVALCSVACGDPREVEPVQPPADSERLQRLEAAIDVDCGSFTVNGCPSVPATALTCLQDALDQQRPARLQQTFITDEGAPIIKKLFVVDNGASWGVLQIADTRADGWGPQGIWELACTGVASSGPTVSGCEYVVPTGCAPQ